MDPQQNHNLLLSVGLDSELSDVNTQALRIAVQSTTQELAVFVVLAPPLPTLSTNDSWIATQRRVAELYAISVDEIQKSPQSQLLSVDVVLVDFCAYSADDMVPYKGFATFVATKCNVLVPSWWPEDNKLVYAFDPKEPVEHSTTDLLLGSGYPWKQVPHLAVGGTFDHLHFGHKILLTAAAIAASRKITCGISTDDLLKNKKYKEMLESYRVREINTLLFLRKIRKDLIIELAPISDPYGPTAVDGSIAALVVSQETLQGSASLNVRRGENNLPPMELLAVDILALSRNSNSSSITSSVSSSNTALKMSSTAIRQALAEKKEKTEDAKSLNL